MTIIYPKGMMYLCTTRNYVGSFILCVDRERNRESLLVTYFFLNEATYRYHTTINNNQPKLPDLQGMFTFLVPAK
jgi:hypothetical protein